MDDLVHNFGTRKHKQGASFKQAIDATLEVVGEADQHSASRGSEEWVIWTRLRWDFKANRLWKLLSWLI